MVGSQLFFAPAGSALPTVVFGCSLRDLRSMLSELAWNAVHAEAIAHIAIGLAMGAVALLLLPVALLMLANSPSPNETPADDNAVLPSLEEEQDVSPETQSGRRAA